MGGVTGEMIASLPDWAQELLEQDKRRESELRNKLESHKQAVGKAMEIINDLIAFARSTNGCYTRHVNQEMLDRWDKALAELGKV